MKIKITVTTGSTAVVSAITFDPVPPTSTAPASRVFAQTGSLGRLLGSMPDGTPINLQYHTDAHGNVTALSDAYGNLSTAYYTDAWGNVIAGSSTQNPYVNAGNHGYWQDADLGLNYVRARWLNPATGTWLSKDPEHDQLAYQYVNNQPTFSTDVTGRAPSTSMPKVKKPQRGDSRLWDVISHPDHHSHAAVNNVIAIWNSRHPDAKVRTIDPKAPYPAGGWKPRDKPWPVPHESTWEAALRFFGGHAAEGAKSSKNGWETGSYLGDVGAFGKGELLAVPRGLWSAFNTFGDFMLGAYNWPARKEFIPPTLTSSTAWKQRGNQALKFAHGFNFFDQPDLESSGNSFFNDELIAAAVAPKVAPYVQATGRATRLWVNETLEARGASARPSVEGATEPISDPSGHRTFPRATYPPKTPHGRVLTELRRPIINGKPIMELPGTNPLKLDRKLSVNELGNLMRIFGNEVGLWRRGSDYFLTSGEARVLPGPWPDAEFIYDGHGHPRGGHIPSFPDYAFVERRLYEAQRAGLQGTMESKIIVHKNATGRIADFIGRGFGEYFVPRDYMEVTYGFGDKTNLSRGDINPFVQFPGDKPRFLSETIMRAQGSGKGAQNLFRQQLTKFEAQFTRAELRAMNISDEFPDGTASDER